MTDFTVGDIPRLTAELFDNSGLERAFGTSIDPRPQQRELSVAVAECLSKGGKLVAEAPTGVGKTFAYLAPAALMAWQPEFLFFPFRTDISTTKILEKGRPSHA